MTNKEVQPFIKKTTKNVIYKMSYITNQPVKQICGDLCLHSLADKRKLIEELAPFVKWSIKIDDVVCSPADKPIKDYPLSGNDLERVNVKIDINSFELVRGLAYSVGWSIAKVVAFCIERSMSDFDFLNQYISEFIETSMDNNEKSIINKFANKINESLDDELSIPMLLIDIVEEKPIDQNLTEAVQQVAIKW